jgi:hypothetical protein
LPSIWCAISGHGFGHAAQVIPVLNELGRHVPRLTAILRTTVPSTFFQDRLTVPWSPQAVQQDVGCIQKGPLDIDIPATWEAHREFHATWESRVNAEAAAMRAAGPNLILADTPYLAVTAGKQTGIPTVVLANFTWHEVLVSLDDIPSEHHALLQSIRTSYGHADMAFRIAPGLPLSGLREVVDIGPIAEPASSQRVDLRSRLEIAASERLVLVGFGGIPLESLPWDQMEQMWGFHFLIPVVPPGNFSRIHSWSTVSVPFTTVLASVDLVMTKPGYGTIVEAVALGLPVLYVRRYNFADEAPLVAFLHDYGRGRELSRQDFISGHWRPALEAALSDSASPHRPPLTGASDSAKALLRYFQ